MPTNNRKKLYVLGTQHLDVAWLWNRVPHGEDLQRMVFELALDLAERHPDAGFVMFRSTARVAWNPDVFAHGITLPQIFARTGLTARPAWRRRDRRSRRQRHRWTPWGRTV